MNYTKYNLTWQLYSDHLREMLHEMMETNELTDVTLVCDDKTKFKAHKIVLSACSSVFKSIVNDLPQNSSVIYLRGIQHQEMESILEFMYLGVATFSQERINEFLKVARNLEIKEISKDVKFDDANEATELLCDTETKIKLVSEQTNTHVGSNEIEIINNLQLHKNNTTEVCDRETETKLVGEQQKKPDVERNEISDKNRKSIGNDLQIHENTTGMFECDQCENKYSQQSHLNRHILSKHEGHRYECNQCDQKYTDSSSLRKHKQAKHEGVIYACNQCNFESTYSHTFLRDHIQAVHEGIKFSCDQCDYIVNSKRSLKYHKKTKHEI